MLTVLNPLDDAEKFPDTETALEEPDGLLAVGGCLSPRRLENAYRHGIFPWYNENEPIIWWSPNPRMILNLEKFRISRSLRKTICRGEYEISFDKSFKQVIDACAGARAGAKGTWITSEIKRAYVRLYQLGRAHSVETWHHGVLAGGLYGVAIGQVFFGESMFYRRSNASKVALAGLVEMLKSWNYVFIDCQVHTSHLTSLGAGEISRKVFTDLLARHCEVLPGESAWRSVASKSEL